MYVLNITTQIDLSIETEWVEWQKKEFIPAMINTASFTHHHFFKLLNQDESEGITYITQYFFSDLKHYNSYLNQFSKPFTELSFSKWGNHFISFKTIMQSVQ